MSLEKNLSSVIHGISVNRAGVDVVCDLPHEVPQPVDTDQRVQYECIRVDNSVTVFKGICDDRYDSWAPDLLRCSDCERDELEEPTDGFGEALVEVDIGVVDGTYVIDASELHVLDYSPADEVRIYHLFRVRLSRRASASRIRAPSVGVDSHGRQKGIESTAQTRWRRRSGTVSRATCNRLLESVPDYTEATDRIFSKDI
ncbi:MAG: hypothetical protein ACI80F_000137 [Natronomonas sp.]|jgi:hypothetical protein